MLYMTAERKFKNSFSILIKKMIKYTVSGVFKLQEEIQFLDHRLPHSQFEIDTKEK